MNTEHLTTLDDIFAAASETSGYDASELAMGRYGRGGMSWWRQVAVYVARERFGFSALELGTYMDRSPSGVSQLMRPMAYEATGKSTWHRDRAQKAIDRLMVALIPPITEVEVEMVDVDLLIAELLDMRDELSS
jgi:hypothetical protein